MFNFLSRIYNASVSFEVKIVINDKKNCFISIPQNYKEAFDTEIRLPAIFKIDCIEDTESTSYYACWDGSVSEEGTISISNAFARNLKLMEGMRVCITHIENEYILVDTVKLTVDSREDYEVLIEQQDFLENTLMNTVLAVSIGQRFTVWTESQGNITLKTIDILPYSDLNYKVGLLQWGTKFDIELADYCNVNKAYSETFEGELENDVEDYLFDYTLKNESYWLRIQDPSSFNLYIDLKSVNDSLEDKVKFPDVKNMRTSFTNGILVSKKTADKMGITEKSILKIGGQRNTNERRLLLNVVICDNVMDNHVVMSYAILHILSYEICDYVNLRPIEFHPCEKMISSLNDIYLFPFTIVPKCNTKENKSKSEIKKERIEEGKSHELDMTLFMKNLIILWTYAQFQLLNSLSTSNAGIEIKSESDIDETKKIIVYESSVISINFRFDKDKIFLNKAKDSEYLNFETIPIVNTFFSSSKNFLLIMYRPELVKIILNKVTLNIKYQPIEIDTMVIEYEDKIKNLNKTPKIPEWLHNHSLKINMKLEMLFNNVFNSSKIIKNSILFCGTKRCGKSNIIKSILKNRSNMAFGNSYIEICECKKNENTYKKLCKKMENCYKRAPSILFIDDIEYLCPNPQNNKSQNNLSILEYISHFIIHKMEEYRHNGIQVLLIANCTDKESLSPSLLLPGSFGVIDDIPPLSIEDKKQLLDSFLEKLNAYLLPDALKEFENWANHLDFDGLYMLAHKAYHCAIVNSDSIPLIQKITYYDISHSREDCVLNNNTPMTQAYNKIDLTKVGGMSEVKETLNDIITMNIKYSKFIKLNCPLRPSSNILLYGPSGCGKTYIINALAVSLDVNLITVKGSELLNKYIGESEAAVRDVFEKASKNTPCILFFDQFDSLASKRGTHLSGVNDRVVNQLLAEMDGVERYENISVIAASSHPHLLDNALLRPGRLDKHVYCGFPDERDRYEILEILTENFHSFRKIELITKMAEETEGYTSADLASIISEAQLLAVDSHINKEHMEIEFEINDEHLEMAFNIVQKSISDIDKKKLDVLYDNFRNDKIEHEEAHLVTFIP